jgi:hypothetical protein
MAARNEYTDTVRDLHAMIRKEQRIDLAVNLQKMEDQLDKQRDQLTVIGVLEERVDALSYLVKGVVIVCALEIIAGAFVFLLTRH